MKEQSGVIISSLGGSYKVASEQGSYICKARGVFRSKNITPYCGDRVIFDGETGVINDILPRKNEIIRPPLANLDSIVFVNSTCEPAPNFLLLDKFLAVAEYKGIAPIVVFTKTDKSSAEEYAGVYEKIYPTFCIDNTTGQGCKELAKELSGKFSAVTGNSGSGKSSLLNNLCPSLNLETNEISKKLGRGKHTTRRIDIFQLEGGGYIADTPGFSSFETGKYDIITTKDLPHCFPEFKECLGNCQFLDCSHTQEKGCAVIHAVKDGMISSGRHKSYVEMYAEARLIKPWEHKK